MSSFAKSSFNSRKRNQSMGSRDRSDAMLTPSNQEENLLRSQSSASEDSQYSIELGISDNEAGRNHIHSGTNSSYRSSSHEPKTPEDNATDSQDHIHDNNNNDSTAADNQNYSTNEDNDSLADLNDSLIRASLRSSVSPNNIYDKTIPEHSTYAIENYDDFEPSLYNTDILGSLTRSRYSNDDLAQQFNQSMPTDALSFLVAQEGRIQNQLQSNLETHLTTSKKGLSSKNIRKNIENCMRTCGSVYQAISELYEKELKRKKIIYTSFQEWDHDKVLLRRKIEDIRDEKHGEGHRLKQLIKDSDLVSDEISQLEKRLKQLKEKKNVLKNEIAQSQSIIESRASSYCESLKEIEKHESMAITKISKERTINSGMSNEALGFPMSGNNGSNRGYNFKTLLMNISSHVTPNSYDFDSKPVMEMLERQIESYNDCVELYSEKETSYTEATIIWSDISKSLNELEQKISLAVQNQGTGKRSQKEVKDLIFEYLSSSKDLLSDRLTSIPTMDSFLKKIIHNEIVILEMAIQFLDPNTHTKPVLIEPTRETRTVQKQPSPPPAQPTTSVSPIPKINIPKKTFDSTSLSPTVAIGSGGFSSTPSSFSSQLRTQVFNNGRKQSEKQTKRD